MHQSDLHKYTLRRDHTAIWLHGHISVDNLTCTVFTLEINYYSNVQSHVVQWLGSSAFTDVASIKFPTREFLIPNIVQYSEITLYVVTTLFGRPLGKNTSGLILNGWYSVQQSFDQVLTKRSSYNDQAKTTQLDKQDVNAELCASL